MDKLSDPIQCPGCRCEFVLPDGKGITFFQAERSRAFNEACIRRDERQRIYTLLEGMRTMLAGDHTSMDDVLAYLRSEET